MKQIIFVIVFFIACNSHETVNTNKDVTHSSVALIDDKKGDQKPSEFTFYSGDSLLVTIKVFNDSARKIGFVIHLNGREFNGIANLVLLEDNGQFFLPESTPILDQSTNEEYICDSTFSYESNKVNFIFAMEKATKKRLSFIVNNSLIKEIEDNFYTLYMREDTR